MYHQQLISKPMFALELRKDEHLLHLGDFNRSYTPVVANFTDNHNQVGKPRWFSRAYRNNWSLELIGVQFGSFNHVNEVKEFAILDSSSPKLVLNLNHFSVFTKQLLSEGLCAGYKDTL